MAEISEAGAQAKHAGDRWRAGLETQWCRAEAGLLVIAALHHLTAKLPRLQTRQGIAAAIEYADAVRAIQLVAGKYIEVAAQRLHVGLAVHGALGAIDRRQCALRFGQRQQGRQRQPAAEHVG